MDRLDGPRRVGDGAVGRRVGDDRARDVRGNVVGAEVDVEELDAQGLGAGAHDRERLRQEAGVEDERTQVLATGGAAHERHRLGGCGALVEQGGVRGGQAGQVGDHRLVVQQRLEPALRDLGLVGRVGRVPGRVLQHVASDDGRRHGGVVAEADHRDARVVAGGEGLQRAERGLLAERRGERRGRRRADRLRDGGLHERVEGRVADALQHGLLVAGTRADVPVDEDVGRCRQRAGRRGGVRGHAGTPGIEVWFPSPPVTSAR